MDGSRGRTGGPDPPEKSQKYTVYLQYWSGCPENSESYQVSIQCLAIFDMRAKHHLYGVSLAGHSWAKNGPLFVIFGFFLPSSP